jgi:hypothetical protein
VKEFFARLKYLFKPSGSWLQGYDAGYAQGLNEGSDFGKRIAYNSVLTKEVPHILSRYSQLQVKLVTKPKSEIQDAFKEFTQHEIDRFKMELQDR